MHSPNIYLAIFSPSKVYRQSFFFCDFLRPLIAVFLCDGTFQSSVHCQNPPENYSADALQGFGSRFPSGFRSFSFPGRVRSFKEFLEILPLDISRDSLKGVMRGECDNKRSGTAGISLADIAGADIPIL